MLINCESCVILYATSRPVLLAQLNEDMEGCIEMLSQTGPFSIPVMCIRKKCLVSTTSCLSATAEPCTMSVQCPTASN